MIVFRKPRWIISDLVKITTDKDAGKRSIAMVKDQLMQLYEYNCWANHRILAATGEVSRKLYSARADVSHGSLRGTLVHILAAEWVWRQRCQEGLSPASLLRESEFPNLMKLRSFWEGEEESMRAYLSNLKDEAFDQAVKYITTIGVPFENYLWQILFHLVNHGTQFRSEASVLLIQYGASPGDLDFIASARAG
jgi:uncharacterized damage-inducible protein DinB